MEIICCNSKFAPDVLEFYKLWGVVTPTEGTMYNIRDVIKDSLTGNTGFLLEELKNPEVLIKHHIFKSRKVEPNWHSKRFTNLMGEEITQEMLRELDKETKPIIITKPEHLVGAQ